MRNKSDKRLKRLRHATTCAGCGRRDGEKHTTGFVLVHLEVVPGVLLDDSFGWAPTPVCVWCQVESHRTRERRRRKVERVRHNIGLQVRAGQGRLFDES